MASFAVTADPAITCSDWRSLPSAVVTPLLEQEAAIWRRDLFWDVRDSWRVIEPARAAGLLPGIVAFRPDGSTAGWTWYLNHHGCLQVAALVADDAAVVRALVHAVQTSPEAAACREQVWSVRGEPAGLHAALQAAGLRVAPYVYLRAEIGHASAGTPLMPPATRLLTTEDLPKLSVMFARAYEASAAIRAFATDGSAGQWEAYLKSLIETDGCGTSLPYASLVMEESAQLQAAVICSSIDREARVAHLGQIAVDPGLRGRGVGRALVESALSRCAAAGYSSMTLLVAEENSRARRLYESLGFQPAARLTVAATS